MEHARQQGASERHACQLVHQPRGTQRYQPTQRNDEDTLTRAIVVLATQYGRYGYRRITIKLQEAGWNVGKDRVERIWHREGLKVPQKQKPRGRLWLNDGSCVLLRPNHVWSYDFMSAYTHDGRTVRFLNLIDEYTRECLAIHVGRRINSHQVIEVLADAMIEHGIPEHIRSDNGPEFVAKDLRKMARCNRLENTVHRTRFSMGERLLRKFQLKDARRISKRRNLLFHEGGARADRTLARLLQHRQATLFAGLQTTSTSGKDHKQHGAWKSGKQTTLPTFPHPRLRRDRLTSRCATLTISLVQITGQATTSASAKTGTANALATLHKTSPSSTESPSICSNTTNLPNEESRESASKPPGIPPTCSNYSESDMRRP